MVAILAFVATHGRLLIGIACVALALIGVHIYNGWQQGIGEARIQALWNTDKAERIKREQELTEKVAELSGTLQGNANADLQQSVVALQGVAGNLSRSVASLSNRPDRGKGNNVPNTTGTCTGQTGAALAKPDGLFLAGYSADAAKLEIALNYCERRYNEAKLILDNLASKGKAEAPPAPAGRN